MNHVTVNPPADLATWARTRAEILRAAEQVMGPLPAGVGPAPEYVVLEEVDAGTFLRQRITYQADDGCDTPAFLCVPRSATTDTPCPAALCLHPTNLQRGYEDVVGLSGKPNRSYASELAARGFVTIAPAYPLMAGYQPDIEALGYVSGTMKAIHDNRRALDLVTSLACVDASRMAAIGHSLGGHNAVYTAAFDERIGAVVSNCGLDSYLDYMGGDITGWTQTRYMPRLGTYDRLQDIPFDFHDLIAALAPRACLICAPFGDTNFDWKSVDGIADAARAIYRLHGAEDRLQVLHPDCPHDFPPDVREYCYDFIEGALADS